MGRTNKNIKRTVAALFIYSVPVLLGFAMLWLQVVSAGVSPARAARGVLLLAVGLTAFAVLTIGLWAAAAALMQEDRIGKDAEEGYKMILTPERLAHFNPCHGAAARFAAEFPNGLDLSGLWGTDEEANATWHLILGSWMKAHIGWAIRAGILPARIRADLGGANLYAAGLAGADLHGASLSDANLYGADLAGASLFRADLSGANLCGADLCRTTLFMADLAGASLSDASLAGADLTGAKWDETTIWPYGFRPPRPTTRERED